MTAVHEDTCIGLFAFAVNLNSLKKQPNEHNFKISQVDAVPYQEIFLHIGMCTRTLTKLLESTPSYRQTRKSYGFI